MSTGPAQPFSLVPEAARKQAERTFGARLQAFIAKAGVSVVDVARVVGTKRETFYKLFDDRRSMPASWLELLPPVVERLYLEERAAHHGLELTPVPSGSEAAVALHDLVGELSDVMRAAADAERDDHISVEEAQIEHDQWDDVLRIAPVRRAWLRRVIEERGRVLPMRRTTR